MSRLLVDTSVISYLLKKHSLAPLYWEILKGNLLGISFMTVAELYRWPMERSWSERRIADLRLHFLHVEELEVITVPGITPT